MSDMNEFLSPADVASLLKVHVKTVHIWLREGKLKGTKLSYRTWRISRPALDDFLKGKTTSVAELPNSSGVQTSVGNQPLKKDQEVPINQIQVPGHHPQELGHPPGEMKQYLKRILHESESHRSQK